MKKKSKKAIKKEHKKELKKIIILLVVIILLFVINIFVFYPLNEYVHNHAKTVISHGSIYNYEIIKGKEGYFIYLEILHWIRKIPQIMFYLLLILVPIITIVSIIKKKNKEYYINKAFLAIKTQLIIIIMLLLTGPITVGLSLATGITEDQCWCTDYFVVKHKV